MNSLILIVFLFAFIYWVHFLFTQGNDERGQKINYYTSITAATGLVLGIIILDLYSEVNEMSLESCDRQVKLNTFC
ncbi:hypothetical protein CIL05_16440 [Virgibacillus profundi]|uniref:Uncharacterized protein n=1 Tax=Virgibacillus profundi TaxID=2024555 RepID=A0A2A2IAB5_9BACI|nr:hypothetical protein [Virgibacillus profundi]PAV28522.1 hypothetical protein CIL05_16440 [Virgibacillus profundi]PXY52695.1 hypothetical protein CIT14_16585 [Virgibacillus profundi]